MTKASDNDFPSVLFSEQGSAPSTPPSGKWRLYTKSDGLYIVDDTGASTGPFAESAAGTTFYTPPTITNYAAQFAGSATTCAVTVTAPTAGDNLVAIVYATGRGANSITHTNVTWTQRYTGNGNSQYLEVWTGVAASSAGTTATGNFTGSNNQYIEIFTANSAASDFTAASAVSTGTAATTALTTVSGATTVGNYYILATSAASPASSYSGASQSYQYLTAFGGIARSGILRSNTPRLSYWSLSATAVNYFTAIIAIS